jgi:hypothetical protein
MAKNKGPSLFRDAIAAAKSVEELGGTSAAAVHETGRHELRHEDVRFEPKDVNARNVVLTGASVLIGAWIVVCLMYFFFSLLQNHREAVMEPAISVAEQRPAAPPEPRIQASPRTDLQRYEARQDYLLSHYLWVDKSKGVVAIPIERAMELIAQRGIPPQKASPGMVLSSPEEGTRLTGFEGKVEPEPR